MLDRRYRDIENEVKVVADAALDLGGRPLNPDLSGELDSIKKLTLLVAIEDHFGIALDSESDAEILTLADLVLALESKLR